jgi:acetolactate synthase-1/2/3 large subunit
VPPTLRSACTPPSRTRRRWCCSSATSASDQRDREAFQEVDYNNFFGPSTKGMAKRVERIDDPNRVPEYVARAFATAMNGRPGPVVLVLPEDMLTQPTWTRGRCRAWTPCSRGATRARLRTLRELLLAASARW